MITSEALLAEAASSSCGNALVRFFSGAGHVFSHVFFSSYAVVVVGLAARGEFGGDYATLLPLVGLGLFLYGLCAIPAGLLGDRWSGPWMMVLFFVGSGGAAMYSGLAESRYALWIGLSLIGLFGAIYHPVGISWLVRNSSRRGWSIGVNGMIGSLTVGVTPPLAGVLIDVFSWRAAFLVPGFISFALGVVLAFLVITQQVGEQGVRESPYAPSLASGREIGYAILFLSLGAICTGAIFSATSNIMPKFVADLFPAIGTSMTMVGLAVAPIYLVGAVAQLAGGYLSDRFSLKWIYITCWMVTLLALLPLVWFTGVVALPFAVLAVSFNSMSLTPENMMYARFSPPAWRGTFYGIKFVLAFGIGWPAVEVAGWIYGRTGGFDELFQVLLIAVVLGLAAALALPRTPVRIPDVA